MLERVPFANYLLHRMPLTRIPDIIRSPARRVGLTVEPALVDQATEDAVTGDALPLLSFALERLWLDHGRAGTLTHDAYEAYARQEEGVRISPIETWWSVPRQMLWDRFQPQKRQLSLRLSSPDSWT